MTKETVARIVMGLCTLVLSTTSLFAAEVAASLLDCRKDKESYSIGYQVGLSMKVDGVEVSVDQFNQGLRDAINGEQSRLSEQEMRKLILDLRKKSHEARMAKANSTSGHQQSTVQAAQTRTVQKANLTITGKIVKGEQGYIIQGKKPPELFTILNPNGGVLDPLVESGETVTIEAVSVMGDNVEILEIDGKSY